MKDRRPRSQRSKYDPSTKNAGGRTKRRFTFCGIDFGSSDDTFITTSEGTFKMEKMEKKPEIKCEDLPPGQGCGVNGCPICMPKSGGGGGLFRQGRTATESRGFVFPTMDGLTERISSEIERRLMYGVISTLDVGIPSPPKDDEKRKADARRYQLESAERTAREEVKQWLIDASAINVSWEDIAGNEEAHEAMIEAIEFPIKYAELYRYYDKKPTKGIALCGPPGCGKTMLGKAAASVISKLHGTKAAMLHVKASELQQPYIGQTEEIIRNLFKYAKAYKALYGHQLVMFIDEADAILPCRDGGPNARRALPWEESNVSTFLTEMDGLEESAALVILGTNRIHAIDPAILRDGRIDRRITVRRPDEASAMIIARKAFATVPTIYDRAELVEKAISELFSPIRHLMTIKTERGRDFLCLRHCVSGAMIVGLVERVKGIAFHRDIKANTMTGVDFNDIMVAIDVIMKEKMENPDVYALREFAQAINSPLIEIDRVQHAEIKYTGTLQ